MLKRFGLFLTRGVLTKQKDPSEPQKQPQKRADHYKFNQHGYDQVIDHAHSICIILTTLLSFVAIERNARANYNRARMGLEHFNLAQPT